MNEQLSKMFKDPKRNTIYVGILSFTIGTSLGYILGRKTKKKQYVIPPMIPQHINADELADLEEFAKEHDAEVVVPGELIDTTLIVTSTTHPPESMLRDGLEIYETDTERYYLWDASEETWIPSDKNATPDEFREAMRGVDFHAESETEVITIGDDTWDYEEENERRRASRGEPYILHRDEFYAEEMDFMQVTLMCYSGDDIVVDQDGAIVYNYSQAVGPLRFGHGSGDPAVVYVRNEQLKREYEIIFDPGFYSVEVLGLEVEESEAAKDIKHSHQRKFKRD